MTQCDVPCASNVIEVFPETLSYDEVTETVYIEAEVEDSILMRPATHLDPEEWGPGRCSAEILWPSDDEDMGFPTSDAVTLYCKTNPFVEWTFIPFNE